MRTDDFYRRAVEAFGARVHSVADDQWSAPTPCTDWVVRDLVNHVVNENLWVPPLLEGQTMEEVGDRFEGDVLGEDPTSAWRQAAEDALAAAGDEGAMERSVNLSGGGSSARDYIAEVATDHVIHAWDLSVALSQSDALDEELVEAAYSVIEPQVEAWRAGGAFGDEVEVPPGADRQSMLLALAGRRRGPIRVV